MREEEGQLSPSRFLEGQRAERGGRLSPFLPFLDGDKEERGQKASPLLLVSFKGKEGREEEGYTLSLFLPFP